MLEKICCIEDGREYQILIENALHGFELVFCPTLADAKNLFARDANQFSLIILDVSLPDGNGIRFLSEAKIQGRIPDIPVFVVTTNNDVMNKVTAFGLGVDDYVVKPFDSLEFRARVEAKVKQYRSRQTADSRLQFGNLIIDFAKMTMTIVGAISPLEVTPLEFKVMSLLMRHPGNVYSRQQIIEEVWGNGTNVTDRTVDAHISHLRKKIIDSNVEVSTVLSAGYKVALRA